jgi:5'-methylthioinosine phosphorylase
MIGLIGGSGLSRLPGLNATGSLHFETRWGHPSGPLIEGNWQGVPLVFLPRHGAAHSIPPHRINYRANLWALKEAGARAVIAVAATGGLGPDCIPGALVVPDQLIDYTWGRASTFFEGEGADLVHVDFTEPYDPGLRADLVAAAGAGGLSVVRGGVYGCTQGPRLETAAEIRRLARDGCTVVGMTGMPEAALARELGLPYACLAVVANYAAGLDPGGTIISIEDIHRTLERAMVDACRVLEYAVPRVQARLAGVPATSGMGLNY